MKNFVARGDVVKIVASGPVASGAAVVIGDRVGIACHDATNGEDLYVQIEGIVEYDKTNVAMAVGKKAYYDVADDDVQLTDDGGTNKPIGWIAQDAASADAKTLIKLGAF